MDPANFAPIRPRVLKLRHFFEVTDGWTHSQKRITSVPLQILFFLHICEGEGGKLYKPYKICTASLVKDKNQIKKLGTFMNYIEFPECFVIALGDICFKVSPFEAV